MNTNRRDRTALECARSGQYPHTLLTMKEAAQYMGFTGPRGADHCREFLQKHGARLLSRGRDYLVRVSAIDALLESGKGDLDREAERLVRK